MPPSDASLYGLKDKDIVKVEIEGPRGGILGEVLVRVDPSFTLEMHIDTDEANALGIASQTENTLTGFISHRCKVPTKQEKF